ncbi:MAG TPA: DUF4899 domain-containing protein [Pseudothermotoga sp.]|nr:DUF4899 domain-containing protein [Pseudothermotoga sp.]HOK83911.1 DUF4899 domain-containing protein [Pseudothermotoga sp.]HPP70703.1 DUF4899 domain-containing protein [Pseudothermotoga sp.]
MDFYLVKYRLKSRVTAEEGIGFLFGKANEQPEYDLVVLPSRYSSYLNIDLSLEYAKFMKSFNEMKTKVFAQIPESSDLSREFMNYLSSYISRKGSQIFGAEITAAVQDKDIDLVQYIVSEIFKEWAPKIEVTVDFKQVNYEEISAENFMQLWEEFDDEGLAELLKRPDISELPEIFPLVDPIRGRTLVEFDLGDPLFFVVFNVRNPQNLEKLRSLYPKHFSDRGNIVPLSGTLVGKELVRGKKQEYFLIKVDMGEGIMARGIVPKSVKIMSEQNRFEEKVSSMQQQKWEDKISQMVQENGVIKEKAQKPQLKSRTEHNGSDFLLAFLMTLMVLGIILIASYFFTQF